MDNMVEIVVITVAEIVWMMECVTDKMEHVDHVPWVIKEGNAIRVWLKRFIQYSNKLSFINQIRIKYLICTFIPFIWANKYLSLHVKFRKLENNKDLVMFSNIQANSFNTKLMREDFSNFAMTKFVLQNKNINRVEKYTLIFSQNIMMSTIKNRGMESIYLNSLSRVWEWKIWIGLQGDLWSLLKWYSLWPWDRKL